MVVACTDTPATVVTSTTVTTTTTTTAPETARLVDHVTGLDGIVPDGWIQTEYGVYRPGDGSPGVFVTWFLPSATGDEAVGRVSSAFGDITLADAGRHEGGLGYDLFDFEASQGLSWGTALDGRSGVAVTGEGAYVVVVAMPQDADPSAVSLESALDELGRVGSADAAMGGPPDDALYLDVGAAPADRVADLVSRMSLREKLGQMTLIEKDSVNPAGVHAYGLGGVLSGGGGSPDDNTSQGWADMVDGYQTGALATRLGIPMLYGVDAVHGHGNLDGATLFPHNIALGAANDPDLVRRIGRATALETAATGIRWNFAPVLAVSGDIRWGRTYETFGSDPRIVSTLGVAYIEGLQGNDLSAAHSVMATAKHFIGDGSTEWGSSTTADYEIDQGVAPDDDVLLRDVLVPPYQEAISAGAGSVMVSFSSWGDTKMHGSDLITDLLKDELGFGGFVVSDWGGIDQVDADYREAVVTGVNAGIDMNMVPYDPVRFMWTLGQAVDAGDVGIDRINDAVTRILTAKFEMGLFEDPMADRSLAATVGSTEHRDLAREAVAKSAVLLKNEGVFPIGDDVETILVIGEAADDPGMQAGGWTITWQGRSGGITGATSILQALEEGVPPGTEVMYSRIGRLPVDQEDLRTDLCIGVVGEPPYAEGFGDDADLEVTGLGLLGNLDDHCERSAMILVTGRPVMITDYLDDWDALVAAWWFGSEAAGLVDVMYGAMPFTARLPVDWPRSVTDLPTPDDPLFPRGFGLGE